MLRRPVRVSDGPGLSDEPSGPSSHSAGPEWRASRGCLAVFGRSNQQVFGRSNRQVFGRSNCKYLVVPIDKYLVVPSPIYTFRGAREQRLPGVTPRGAIMIPETSPDGVSDARRSNKDRRAGIRDTDCWVSEQSRSQCFTRRVGVSLLDFKFPIRVLHKPSIHCCRGRSDRLGLPHIEDLALTTVAGPGVVTGSESCNCK